MKRNNLIDKLLSETEKEKEERREIRKKEIEKLTESYQLGYLVGEKISSRLPILSTSGITGNIKIQIQELDHYNKIRDEWFNEKDEKKRENLWLEMRKYSDMLDEKYLPKVFKTTFRVMNINDMKEFKYGIQSALWDSDFCYYNISKIDDFNVEIDEDYYFMDFIFYR